MIVSRMRKKFFELSGLVKKSAMLSRVFTYGTRSCMFSTQSRMKKWRRSICFVREWNSGLYEIAMAVHVRALLVGLLRRALRSPTVLRQLGVVR